MRKKNYLCTAKQKYSTRKMKLENYIEEVKSHLCCNMSEENRSRFVCYEYTNEQVDNNIEYFEDCCNDHISAYTALLLFYDYLQDKKETN